MPGRDNGLQAQTYAPLADLDPRLADAMLELLRDSGIAAYAVPVGSELSGHFSGRMPERPTDRLYVDATATEPAWYVLRTHLPSMDVEREGSGSDLTQGLRDDDAAWQEIIAAFNRESTDPVPPWPASEDIDDESDTAATQPQEATPARHAPEERGPGSDDDHFVPPPPPPVPRPDALTAASWFCLFGGPTYLLISTMIGWPIPGWAAFVAVAAFVGGFVALVVRMGDNDPPDSGPDDGAIV